MIKNVSLSIIEVYLLIKVQGNMINFNINCKYELSSHLQYFLHKSEYELK